MNKNLKDWIYSILLGQLILWIITIIGYYITWNIYNPYKILLNINIIGSGQRLGILLLIIFSNLGNYCFIKTLFRNEDFELGIFFGYLLLVLTIPLLKL